MDHGRSARKTPSGTANPEPTARPGKNVTAALAARRPVGYWGYGSAPLLPRLLENASAREETERRLA